MSSSVVTVLIALYNPNLDWLKVQLNSINNQTYKNIEIIGLDDCSNKVPLDKLKQVFSECLTQFPHKLEQNLNNIGSTGTFEKLTQMTTGHYIAYCDQDDYWHPEKIEKLVRKISSENASLCFSDFSVIDESGNMVSESATKYYKRYKFHHGENVANHLLAKNFIPGCVQLVNAATAKDAIPFAKSMVHDHWIALYSALTGKVSYINESLTYYRIHGRNQTGILRGIENKEDYIRLRVNNEYEKYKELLDRLKGFPSIYPHVKNLYAWVCARISYYRGNLTALFKIIQLAHYNIYLSLFDIIVLKLPNKVFSFALKIIRERKI